MPTYSSMYDYQYYQDTDDGSDFDHGGGADSLVQYQSR